MRKGQEVEERKMQAMDKQTPVHQARFEELSAGEAVQGQHNLDMLLDVPVPLVVELGRQRMKIKEILALAEGSLIPLDREEGEPLDILLNDKVVARGEVVIVEKHLAVRILEVVEPLRVPSSPREEGA